MMPRKIQMPMVPSPPVRSRDAYYSLGGRRPGTALLRAPEAEREREARRGERNGEDRQAPDVGAERAQRGEQPAAGSVGTAHRDDVDHALCLVLLVAPDHGEEHLARRVGDGAL